MKMKEIMNVLGITLGCQVALIAFLSRTPQTQTTKGARGESFIPSLEMTQVEEISLEDGEKHKLILKKVDGTWVLPDSWNFPVSQPKIAETLTKLTEIKVSWPVGKTPIAAKQFETTEDKFERKIVFLKEGKPLAQVYLGTSPSFKKIHGRLEGRDETYALEFNAHDLPTAATGWYSKSIYEKSRTDIQSLSWNDVALENSDAGFKLTGLEEGKETDEAALGSLISVALNPDFEDVLGKDDRGFDALKETFTFSLKTKAGDALVYSLREMASPSLEPKEGETKESEFLAMKVSSQPYTFKVRRSRMAALMKSTKAGLMKTKGAEDQTPKPTETATPDMTMDPMDDSSQEDGDIGEIEDIN
jgi:hypothetical protein